MVFNRFIVALAVVLSISFFSSTVSGQTMVLSNDAIRIVAKKENDSGLISLDFQVANP